MIKNFTIYGERCSGTNYIEELILKNFNIELTWKYGFKHFFGFNDLSNSDDTLFIGIIRNPYNWLNSFYLVPHHIPKENIKNIDTYLNNEWYSVYNKNDNKWFIDKDIDTNERLFDRNLYTKNRYKNIFDMRYTKIKFLIEDMPYKVKNYIFIKYEDLIDNFENTFNKIKDKGLTIKDNIDYPLNSIKYKKDDNIQFIEKTDKDYKIKREIILQNNNFNIEYEKILGYNI